MRINKHLYSSQPRFYPLSKGILQKQTLSMTCSAPVPTKRHVVVVRQIVFSRLSHCRTLFCNVQSSSLMVLGTIISWLLKPKATILLMRSRAIHHFLFPRESGEGLSMCPRVLSISEDQTRCKKTGYQVSASCLCWGCGQSLSLHKRAKRQPAGNLDLYSSANIYRKRSSFSILSRIRCSLSKVIWGFTRQEGKL